MKRFNFFERLSALVVLFAVGSLVAMAGNKDYFSKAIVKVESSATAAGRVYVSKNNSKPADYKFLIEDSSNQKDNVKDAPSHTYYVWALPGFGYEFDSWSPAISNGQVSIKAAENESDATKTYTAKFKQREVSFDNPQVGTYQIVNPSADEDLATGWTATYYQKSNENTFQFIHWEGNHMGGEISQTVDGIPNGLYEVSVECNGVWNDITLYANSDKSTVGVGSTDFQTLKVKTNVTNGSIVIKVENKCTKPEGTSEWCSVDNFKLTYYGQVPTDYVEQYSFNGYIYTEKANGEYVAFGKGAKYGTEATSTNPDGLELNVSVSGYVAKIQYAENQYLYTPDGDYLYTDRGDNDKSDFYMQQVEGGYKFIYCNDVTKAVGVGKDGEYDVVKLVAVDDADVWNFAGDKVNLKVSQD